MVLGGIIAVIYMLIFYLSWSIFIAERIYIQLEKRINLPHLDGSQEKIGIIIRKRTMLYVMLPVIILWCILWVRDPEIAYTWIDPAIWINQSGLFVYFILTIIIIVFIEYLYYNYYIE
jgi:hypothetical protein